MGNELEGASPDAEFDIDSILNAETSAPAEPASAKEALLGQPQQGGAEGQNSFKFGGRQYPSQKEAEATHNKLYGKFSEQQGVLNQLKAVLKNPAAYAKVANDPTWGPILTKLGIQQAAEEQEAEDEAEPQGEEIPQALQGYVKQMQVTMAEVQLDREVMAFERKLGRSITAEEDRAISEIIMKAPSLSIEQAYKLANHDRLLREAAEKAQKLGNPKAQLNRPKPGPLNVPGVPMDTKKKVTDMNASEWREHLKQSDDFQKLISRD